MLTAFRLRMIFTHRSRAIYELGIDKLKEFPRYTKMVIDLRKWTYKDFFGD